MSYGGDHLYVDHIPSFVNEPICIGFFATLPWNEIEIEFNSSVRVHYDVFYAVIGACIEELPPGLPITWLSFEVQKKGEASDLKWVTAQEFNNTGFHVERSADGRYFESIGTIAAANDHAGINQYSFTDAHPLRGMNYYRIKQIDADGRSTYSQVQSIDFSYDRPDITSWPNPARESLNIMLPSDLEDGEIKLINSSGMVVMRKPYVNSASAYSFDISHIDQGLYSLLIETQGQVYLRKIVVLK